MSDQVQADPGISQEDRHEMWKLRWFLVWLYAIALILSIISRVVIVHITKNPYPALIPAPLLWSLNVVLSWAFPKPSGQSKLTPVIEGLKNFRSKP